MIKMKQAFYIFLLFTTIDCAAQKLLITNLNRSKIEVNILDSSAKLKLLKQYNGKQDNRIRKKWTARSFRLSDGRIVVEFFDRQAVVVNSIKDFKSLDSVRFVKNTVDFLKKNISYKIEIGFDRAMRIVKYEKAKRLTRFKSDITQILDYKIYQLSTGQILFFEKFGEVLTAAIYPDLKTVASENSEVREQVFGSDDDEYEMKKLASGDRLLDYDVNDHLIYPKYLKDVVNNHKLKLVEPKVYVSDFFGNLYRSDYGYFILIDEINQENGAGSKMRILSLRIYDSIAQVRADEKKYRENKTKEFKSEHFYKKISDKYGENFAKFVPGLIQELPAILNIDADEFSLDSAGIDLVDEALKWNGTNYNLFYSWFPCVLAYYGECYMKKKMDGKWKSTYDSEYKVWIPEVQLSDGTPAWDWIDFYKELYEGPIPLRWVGDWDGQIKRIRSENK